MRDLSNKLGLLMVSMSVGVYLLDGFLGFHMDLLALFLRFRMDLLALCDGEISVLRRDTTLHCLSLGWFNTVEPSPTAQRARPAGSAAGVVFC